MHEQAVHFHLAAEEADGSERIKLRTLASNFDAAATIVKQRSEDMILQSALHYINRYGKNEKSG